MDRTAYLLVKTYIFGHLLYLVIVADRGFSQPASSFCPENLIQDRFPFFSRPFGDIPLFKRERYSGHLLTSVESRVGEIYRAFRGIIHRCCENLARGHISAPAGIDPDTVLTGKSYVDMGTLVMNLAGFIEQLCGLLLFFPHLFPPVRGVFVQEPASLKYKVPGFFQRHFCHLSCSRGRVLTPTAIHGSARRSFKIQGSDRSRGLF